MTEIVTLNFDGPYSWPGTTDAPSIFDSDIRTQPGIYLWTIPFADGHLIYYVGETGRSFAQRMREHYTAHASGMYHLYSPEKFVRGEKTSLWDGFLATKDYRALMSFMTDYARYASVIDKMTQTYRFMLAPLSVEKRLRQRVEGAMAKALYSADGRPGTFQDAGIRYAPRWDSETPLECGISSTVKLLGLPSTLSV